MHPEGIDRFYIFVAVKINQYKFVCGNYKLIQSGSIGSEAGEIFYTVITGGYLLIDRLTDRKGSNEKMLARCLQNHKLNFYAPDLWGGKELIRDERD